MRADYAKQPKKKKNTLRVAITVMVIVAAMSIPFSLLMIKIARERKQAKKAAITQPQRSTTANTRQEGQFQFYTLLPKSQHNSTQDKP